MDNSSKTPQYGMTHRHTPQDQQFPQAQYQQHHPNAPPPSYTSSSAMKKFNMYYTTSRLNARLHLGSSSSPCIYYMQSSLLKTKPLLQLRLGNSKSAPVVASAQVQYTSRHIVLGSGDNQNDSTGKLGYEMRRDSNRLVRGDYEFQIPDGTGAWKTFAWRVEKSYIKTVYRCLDEKGQGVATMWSGGMCNWSKGGELEIVEGLEKGLEAILVVSALAIWVAEAGWSVLPGYGSKQHEARN